jgi:hypothetical protein
MWCQSVDQVCRHLNQINTPTSTLTSQTMETGDTGSAEAASSSNKSRHNNKPTNETHISQLTIEYFSDAMSDSEDNIMDQEANDYAVLNEEVISGLLGLTSFGR